MVAKLFRLVSILYFSCISLVCSVYCILRRTSTSLPFASIRDSFLPTANDTPPTFRPPEQHSHHSSAQHSVREKKNQQSILFTLLRAVILLSLFYAVSHLLISVLFADTIVRNVLLPRTRTATRLSTTTAQLWPSTVKLWPFPAAKLWPSASGLSAAAAAVPVSSPSPLPLRSPLSFSSSPDLSCPLLCRHVLFCFS